MRVWIMIALVSLLSTPLIAADDIEDAHTAPSSYLPQPPVETWVPPRVTCYDESRLVTCPGCGVGGADLSELQTAIGLSTYGFGHQFALGYAVADEFTVPGSEWWYVVSLWTFAYQTGSSTVSSITGVYVTLYDGLPGAGGNVVFGDFTTNRLVSSTWTNIYRVPDTNPFATDRPIHANVSSVDITLFGGTYWVAWTTEGSPDFTGPWAPPVTIEGQTTTGDGLQSIDGAYAVWDPVLDRGTGTRQGFPFIIGCVTGGATPTEPVSWTGVKQTFRE